MDKQWFFKVRVDTGESNFQWDFETTTKNYGDAMTEMVDDLLNRFSVGFQLKIEYIVIRYG